METYLICLAAAMIGGLMLSRVTKLLMLVVAITAVECRNSLPSV